MATLYTKRFAIVVRADLAAAARLAAFSADTDPVGGDRCFFAALSASGNLPVQAWWCSWQMTVGVALAIRARLVERGATGAEVTPVAPGGTPTSNRFAIFDGDDWPDPDAILTKIGLQRIGA